MQNNKRKDQMGFFANIKQSYKDNQDKKAAEKAAEEARRERIASGGIVSTSYANVNLEEGESSYIAFAAHRKARVSHIVTHTVNHTKKKGVVGRAIVGGVLLGPLGALGGAATAGSRTTGKTTEQIVENLEDLDVGTMIFMDKRFLFMGQGSVVSIPFEKALAIEFSNPSFSSISTLTVKYPEMAKEECYHLSGPDSKIAEIWFKGIKEKNNTKSKGVK